MIALHPYLQSALGGLMIGLASWWLLASLGRIAGISGIAAALLPGRDARPERAWQAAFIAGLVLGGALWARLMPTPTTALRPLPLLLIAGFLVGLGTVMASGCTSGHGVCGVARLSKRSFAATGMFMATAIVTVFVIHRIMGL